MDIYYSPLDTNVHYQHASHHTAKASFEGTLSGKLASHDLFIAPAPAWHIYSQVLMLAWHVTGLHSCWSMNARRWCKLGA